ncbi:MULTISPECIES: anti-sigma factor family protein [unclassified Streptomyces]|uniref:anti-sigma factor family protein n=1 Tax=unclassified Streptomyces TaxID=2593676 RepID=UPI0036E84B1A
MTPTGSYGPRPEWDRKSHLGHRLAELVDGELGADGRHRVLAHLATCQKCKAEADAQRRLKNVSAPATSESKPSFLDRLNAVGFPITNSDVTPVRAQPRREPRAERWTSLAARIAGDRRDMHTAWLADLDGRPEDGVSLTTWQQRRYALGFLVAAVRFILRDSLGHLWRPVDWLLATRNRREAFIGVPPALLVLYIAKHDGVHTLLTEGWGWVGGCGAAMFALVRWLQRVRGIELAEESLPNGE